jgi:putative membrane protein
MQPYIDHGAYFWVGAITRVAFLVLIIVGIVLLVRYLAHRYPAGGHFHAHAQVPPPTAVPSGAMQILEERFARGEIDTDEFNARKEALRS